MLVVKHGSGKGSVLKSLRERVAKFSGRRVLVVGDIMVDRYFWGKVKRISPEAPVPVVELEGETRRLGGAANVAHNILTLGGEPLLCGVAGQDEDGNWLVSEMSRLGMDCRGVFLGPETPTTVKSRVVAHSQQVVRFDRERKGPPSARLSREISVFLKKIWGDLDGVVISDYAKGVVTGRVMDLVRSLAKKAGPPVAVDPKSPSFRLYRRVTVITPNFSEARTASALAEESANIEEIGRRLLAATEARAILITRGEEGMSLFEKGRRPFHIPAHAREVYDVTGAGDTVIGTLSLALAAGSTMREAASLANVAAGVAVEEFGTVPVTGGQLLDRLPPEGSPLGG